MTDDRHRYRDAIPREPARDHTGPIPVVPDPETVFGRVAQEYLAELVRAALVTAPPDAVGPRTIEPQDVSETPYLSHDGALELHTNIGEHAYCIRIREV